MKGKQITVWVVMFLLFSTVANSNVESYQFIDYSRFANVDLYTGDMSLNIPLFTVPGRGGLDFPIVLSYHAGITTNQEASLVGLGWTMGIPTVTRMVSGIPDEYKEGSVNIDIPKTSKWEKFWKNLVSVFKNSLFISTDVGQMAQHYVAVTSSYVNYHSSGDLGVKVNFSGLALGEGNNERKIDGFFNIISDEDLDRQQASCWSPLGCVEEYYCTEANTYCQTGYYCTLNEIPCDEDADCLTPANGQTGYASGYGYTIYDTCWNNEFCIQEYVYGTDCWGCYSSAKLYHCEKPWGVDKEQPDSYFISLADDSGKLVVDKSHNPDLTTDWKLQKTTNAWPDDLYPIFDEDNLIGFRFIAMDGTKYYFTKQDIVQNSKSRTATKKDKSCTDDKKFLRFKLNDPYPYAWKIEKILSIDYEDSDNVPGPSDGDKGNWIKFDYVEYASDFLVKQPHDGSCERAASGYKVKSSQTMSVSYLSSVETPTHRAVFTVDFNREDGKESDGTRNHPKLTEAKLYTKQFESVRVIKYSFNYDYSLVQGAPESSSGRLTLKSVTQHNAAGTQTLPSYQFEYAYGDTSSQGTLSNPTHNPTWEKKKHDRWGYYSINRNEEGISDGLVSDAWSLTKVAWPNGGTTEWVYENDRYTKVGQTDPDADGNVEEQDSHYGGGIRVSLVRNCNGMGECIAEKYLYRKQGLGIRENDGIGRMGRYGESSGVATLEPGHGLNKDDDRSIKGSIHTSAYVGYGRVVRIPFFDEQKNTAPYGYEVYNFTTAKDYPNYGEEGGEKSREHKRGLLKTIEYYGSDLTPVKTVENIYSLTNRLNWNDYIKSGTRYLTKQTQTVDGLTTEISYSSYDVNGLPRRITEENSDGSKRITTTRYAWRQFYPGMFRKHMLSQVYQTKVYKDSVAPGNLLRLTRINWALFDNKWRVSNTQVWNDSNNNGTAESDELITTRLFESYDDYGNLLVLRDAKGNPTYFYYGDNYYLCSNSGSDLKHSVLTCAENSLGHQTKQSYNNIYLLESITDPNSKLTQYGYDSFNRLEKIANPGSSLTNPDTTYSYHFFESSNNPNWAMTTIKIDNSKNFVSKSFFDGIGRNIQSQVRQDNSNWIVSNTVYYDKTNLVEKVYKPIRKNTNRNYDTSEPSGIYSKTIYYKDPLFRLKEVLPAMED